MGPIAARHARTVLEHVERILAIELLCGAEALDQRLALLAAVDGARGAAGRGAARCRRGRARTIGSGPRRARSAATASPGRTSPPLTAPRPRTGDLVDLVASAAPGRRRSPAIAIADDGDPDRGRHRRRHLRA